MGMSGYLMGRLLLGVEVALLLAVVACASGELGPDVPPLSQDELLQISEHEAPKVVPAENRASVMKRAEANLALVEKKQAEKAREAEEKNRIDLKVKLEKERIELDAAEAEKSAERKALQKAQDPSSVPDSPSVAAIRAKAAAVAAEKEKLVMLKAETDAAQNSVQQAATQVQKHKDQVALAKLQRAKEQENEKKMKVIQDAESQAAEASKSEKQKQEDAKAAIAAKQTQMDNAEESLARAQDKAVRQKYADKTALQEEKLQLSETAQALAQAKRDLKKAQVVATAATFQADAADETLAGSKAEEKRAQKAQGQVKIDQDEAISAGDRGKAMLEEAQSSFEVNQNQLSNAKALIMSSKKDLEEALHSEELDKKEQAQTMQSVNELRTKIDALEKKKHEAEAFGSNLRTKALRDAQLAQQGSMKARADYADARKKYDEYMAKAESHGKQYEKDEGERQDAIKSVVMALDENDVQSAILGGQNHEGIQALASLSKKQYDKFMSLAQSERAKMAAAKVDEKNAEKLQLSANKQFDAAASSTDVLIHHRTQLNQLQNEAKANEAHANFVLSEARKKSKQAHDAFEGALKKFKERQAAENYLTNVKMAVAHRLIAKSQLLKEQDISVKNVEDKEVLEAKEKAKQDQ